MSIRLFWCICFIITHINLLANPFFLPESLKINKVNYSNLPEYFKIISNRNDFNILNKNFYETDLSLEVTVNNRCVNNNSSNAYTYTFNIENKGTLPITLSSSNKITVDVEMPSNSLGDFDNVVLPTGWTSTRYYQTAEGNYDYTFTSPSSGSTTILPGQKISFIASRSYTIYDTSPQRILNSKLNYSADQYLVNNSTSTIISRIPGTPGNKTVVKKINEQYTIAQAAGVISNVGNFRFYVDNVQVNSNFLIDLTQAENYYKSYTYSEVLGVCEGPTSTITFRPTPGLISTINSTVCEGANVVINNALDGSGSGGYALKYSWEVSYNNGVTWGTPDDGSLDTDGQKTTTISNITSNLWIRRKAHERPTNTRAEYYAYSNIIKLTVNKNNIIFPEGIYNTIAVKINNQTNTGAAYLPVLTASIPVSTIEYINDAGTVIATNPSSPVSLGNLSLGEYIYEVKAKNTLPGNVVCETVELIKVLVYDAATCSNYTKRSFGTIVKGWTSGLSVYRELGNVTNGNRASYGELNGGVVLLGLGTVGMDIYFTKPDGTLYTGAELKGKKVVIKLGEQYSGLKVAGGISVIGRLTNSGVTAQTVELVNAANVGAAFGVKGGVLDALKGDNVFEFSFIPASSISSTGIPVEFNGIRIQLGSLIGVADLATVFYAYIEEEGNLDTDFGTNRQTYCDFVNADIRVTPPSGMAYPTLQDDIETSMPKLGPITNTNFKLNRSVEDAFWGNYTEVLNVASSLNSVVYPYYAIDDDYDSYSIFNTVVGVLNAKFLQAKLRQKARLGDQVQITLSYPNISVLNLSLLQLGNFKIVYYLNGAKVGEERLEEFRVLDIGLFRFRDKRRAILSKPVNFMFDKVEVREFSAVDVNLGTSLRIHDIRINPLNAFAGMTDPKQVTQLCATAPVVIQKMDPCTEYELSFARVTEFGPEYLVGVNTPMLDYKGQPIRSIYAVQDIPNSTLSFQREDATGSLAYYSHNRTTLFTGADYDGKLLLKIKTKRQGCDFGEPQYLRVNLENCVQGIVNPVIMNSAKF